MARCSARVAPRAATLAFGLLVQLTGIAAYSAEGSAAGDARQRSIPEQTGHRSAFGTGECETLVAAHDAV